MTPICPVPDDLWAVQARVSGCRWSLAGSFPTRSLAISCALTLKASGSEVLVRASTVLTVKQCPSQMTLVDGLVGRFDDSSVPAVLRPSRRRRAALRSTR